MKISSCVSALIFFLRVPSNMHAYIHGRGDSRREREETLLERREKREKREERDERREGTERREKDRLCIYIYLKVVKRSLFY